MSTVILADKAGYEDHYKSAPLDYMGDLAYEKKHLTPISKGGQKRRAYARGLAVSMLNKIAKPGATILEAGSGVGNLSIYLAHQGYNVIGVEISEAGCSVARQRAKGTKNVRFVAASVSDMPSIPDGSIDHIIGLGTFHHFIKYPAPVEFLRVLKPGGQGFFADAFGEFVLYRLFHDKEKMQRLGDVVLNRKLILDYFQDFDVEIIPTEWFGMLDGIYGKFLPQWIARQVSKGHFWLDRHLSLPTALSGVVVTHITKR